ncbi:hypothetical protein FOA52_011588 [Chlamydomonas sp. UWO 241]|nr:hypothetical protein FOA52_011588 [Chlamydomonas sp. UWO 241]
MYEFDHKNATPYFKNVATLTLVLCASYGTLYFLIGEPFSIPDGNMFAVILVWLLGHIGGFIAVQCRIPALLGMLIIGAVVVNLPGHIMYAYKPSWSSHIKAFGLATILMRSGLKIDYVKAFSQSPLTVCLLGTIPVILEGFLVSAVFKTMFDMPWLFAAMAGFLLAPISPTVIVTGMLDLQKQHLAEERGIPSIEMASAGVDVVVGIAMYAIFQSLAIQEASGDTNEWFIARGPASIGIGAMSAMVGGLVCGCTSFLNTSWARTAVVFSFGQLFMFIYYSLGMPGAGALAAIGVAGTAAICWTFGIPRVLSTGPNDNHRQVVDHTLATFWIYVMQPLLFCSIGVSINFAKIPGTVIPIAILIIVVGSLCRMLSASLVLQPARLTKGWTTKEVLFVSLSWIPKATVQGALSSAPLDALKMSMPDHDDPRFLQYQAWAYQILGTAVFSILMTAPAGLIIISMLGPRLLAKPKGDENGFERTLRTGGRDSLSHELTTKEVDVFVATERASGALATASMDVTLSAEQLEQKRTFMFALPMDTYNGKPQSRGMQVDPDMIAHSYDMLLHPISEIESTSAFHTNADRWDADAERGGADEDGSTGKVARSKGLFSALGLSTALSAFGRGQGADADSDTVGYGQPYVLVVPPTDANHPKGDVFSGGGGGGGSVGSNGSRGTSGYAGGGADGGGAAGACFVQSGSAGGGGDGAGALDLRRTSPGANLNLLALPLPMRAELESGGGITPGSPHSLALPVMAFEILPPSQPADAGEEAAAGGSRG